MVFEILDDHRDRVGDLLSQVLEYLLANQLGGHEAQLLVGDLLFWIVARAERQAFDRLPEQLIQSIAVER